MNINTTTLERLRNLLTYKKSKAFYAEKLGISVEQVGELLKELKTQSPETQKDIQEFGQSCTTNFTLGTYESSVVSDFEPKSIEELVKLHKIDLTKYRISSYWTKQRGTKFTSSLLCTIIKESDKDSISEKFIDFLTGYTPAFINKKADNKEVKYNNACLVLPKQDAHFNKWDINGDNDIENRFNSIYQATLVTLGKASLVSNLDEIIYIVGSDQFNSEFTQCTTKGTPQQNILDYNTAFKLICDHELNIINTLLSFSKNVKVLFVPGNHDEYVGWHMAEWLKVYFRACGNVTIDTEIENRKYVAYGSSAIMFNHGDVLKPAELAHKFPIEFRKGWSDCENFYVFTGDKHHEVSKDIHGIEFFQVQQLSTARSRWDDKNGHTCSKSKMTGFLIDNMFGLTDIYKTPIK